MIKVSPLLIIYLFSQSLFSAQYIGDRSLWTHVSTLDRMIVEHQSSKGYEQKLCSDTEFMRRAYLGLTGVIPNAEQAERYLKSKSVTKRADLIDELLSSEGYVHRMYEFFGDLLKVPLQESAGFKMGWGEGEHINWIKHQLRENTKYSDIVYQLITAKGTAENNPAIILKSMNATTEDLAASVSKGFLGIRIGCAQCHNHRFDKWTQKEFYEFASFFGGLRSTYMNREQYNLMDGNDEKLIVKHIGDSKLSKVEKSLLGKILNRSIREVVYSEKKGLKYPDDYRYDNAEPKAKVVPRIIFDYGNPDVKGKDLLDTVGLWLTSKENDQFSRNFVNRMWQKAFGYGIVEPVDDFKMNTEPVNAGVLEYLTKIFIDLDHDMKAFLTVLYNSEFMNTKTVKDDVSEFSYDLQGHLIKRMSSEQIWDTMLLLGRGPEDLYQVSSYDAHRKLEWFNKEAEYLYKELLPEWEKLREKHWPKGSFENGKMKSVPALTKYISGLNGKLSMFVKEMKGYENMLFWIRPTEVKMDMMSDQSDLHEQRQMNFAFRDYKSSSHLNVNHRQRMLLTFGSNDRSSVQSGGANNFSVTQALELLNGSYSDKVSHDQSYTFNKVMKLESDGEKVKYIYLSLLSRYPSSSEFSNIKKLKAHYAKQGSEEEHFWKDLLISLINTPEFLMII